MAFDGIFLRLMKNEIEQSALGARVDKIYMPSKDLLILALRKTGFNGRLLISSNTVGARIQFTESSH